MPIQMDSPLSGRATSRFGGPGRYKNKLILGAAVIAVVPFLLSTFAASVTVGSGSLEFSNLNLDTCVGRKLRLRMIDGTSKELVLGSLPDATVLQVLLPKVSPTSNIGDPISLGLTYLDGRGAPLAGSLAANVSLNVSGTSVYDGTPLSSTSADVTFYLDPTSTLVNIDGQTVRRATVETVNSPN